MTAKEMATELKMIGRRIGIPEWERGKYCQSQQDGDCIWKHCPQNRDDEPNKTGRHCPLDIHTEERGCQ